MDQSGGGGPWGEELDKKLGRREEERGKSWS
jgi:hypothetical protein